LVHVVIAACCFKVKMFHGSALERYFRRVNSDHASGIGESSKSCTQTSYKESNMGLDTAVVVASSQRECQGSQL
jgi:hypothetical protein